MKYVIFKKYVLSDVTEQIEDLQPFILMHVPTNKLSPSTLQFAAEDTGCMLALPPLLLYLHVVHYGLLTTLPQI